MERLNHLQIHSGQRVGSKTCCDVPMLDSAVDMKEAEIKVDKVFLHASLHNQGKDISKTFPWKS